MRIVRHKIKDSIYTNCACHYHLYRGHIIFYVACPTHIYGSYDIHIILLCVAHLIEQIDQWNYYVVCGSFDYTHIECVLFVGTEYNIIGVDTGYNYCIVSIVEMID